MNRICIFGGSFDPPTNGHMQCTAALLRTRFFDEVWVMPCGSTDPSVSTVGSNTTLDCTSSSTLRVCGSLLSLESLDRPDKKLRASSFHRMKMTKIAVNHFFGSILERDNPAVKVSDMEVKAGRFVTTFDSLKGLKEEFPGKTFYWVIGADVVSTISTWHHGPELLGIGRFITFPRNNSSAMEMTEEEYKCSCYICSDSSSGTPEETTEIQKEANARRKKALEMSKQMIECICIQKLLKQSNIRYQHWLGSSTDARSLLRARVQDPQKLSDCLMYVPSSVLSYIKEHDLYLEE